MVSVPASRLSCSFGRFIDSKDNILIPFAVGRDWKVNLTWLRELVARLARPKVQPQVQPLRARYRPSHVSVQVRMICTEVSVKLPSFWTAERTRFRDRWGL